MTGEGEKLSASRKKEGGPLAKRKGRISAASLGGGGK